MIIDDVDKSLDLLGEKAKEKKLKSFVMRFFSDNSFAFNDVIIRLLNLFFSDYYCPSFCDAGVKQFTVSMNGDVYPCQLFVTTHSNKLGNIQDLNDQDLVNHQKSILKNFEKCLNCGYKRFCQTCLKKKDEIENNDDYCCDIKEGTDLFLKCMFDLKDNKKSVKKIEFQNVSFEYEKNHKLFDISMTLEKNRIYQLSGNNGKGKSTFIFLMCGLFKDEYHGVILYDSLEQKELNIEKMNEYMISICEQDPYLFDGTINENLCCKTKKEKRADLRRLLIDFGLFDKINSLDNKFETQISSLNTILSGGEKQKIAIIRTLISDGDVLIFDEPLSALDKKSKIVFQEEISKIKDKIVIIISHEELKKIKKNIVLIKLAPKEENEI